MNRNAKKRRLDMEFSVVVAANDEVVLQDSLLRSPDIRSIKEVIVRRGFDSAARAYNSGLDAAQSDVVVFAHQDVFLPEGWFQSVAQAIAVIAAQDPNWGVLGLFGITLGNHEAGHIYSTGIQRELGQPFDQPIAVSSLDEVLLIVRRSSGLRFDEKLPGFHLYGTDICMEAKRQGLNCYVLSAFCVHNSNGLHRLPSAYSRSLYYLRDKWRSQLPIRTPCMTITRWGLPLYRHYLESLFARNRKAGGRCPDPSALYRQLQHEKQTKSAMPAMSV
jgi:GT2 family glycosyltransferase